MIKWIKELFSGFSSGGYVNEPSINKGCIECQSMMMHDKLGACSKCGCYWTKPGLD